MKNHKIKLVLLDLTLRLGTILGVSWWLHSDYGWSVAVAFFVVAGRISNVDVDVKYMKKRRIW